MKRTAWTLVLMFSSSLSWAAPLAKEDSHDHHHHHDEAPSPNGGILNKAPVVLAAVAAIKESAAAAKLVGISGELSGGEATASLYVAPVAGELVIENYDCHFHKNLGGVTSMAHCHSKDQSAPVAYTAAPKLFDAKALVEGAKSVLRSFQDDLQGELKTIRSFKLWSSEEDGEPHLWARLSVGDTAGDIYFFCHEHDAVKEPGVLDCHPIDVSGAFEP